MNITYHTAFEINKNGFGWEPYGIFLLVISLGALITWFARRQQSPRWKGGMIFVAFGFALFLASLFASFSRYLRLQRAYDRNDYALVEGIVEDFRPIPPAGHQEECFTVKSQRFCYSDAGTPAFNNIVSRGGPIKPGLHVRIAYIGNDILRLEVASGKSNH